MVFAVIGGSQRRRKRQAFLFILWLRAFTARFGVLLI